jgi:hypothetical protein
MFILQLVIMLREMDGRPERKRERLDATEYPLHLTTFLALVAQRQEAARWDWSMIVAQGRNYSRGYDVFEGRYTPEVSMLKVIGWVVGIIFLIGLLVVFGIFDLIF